MASPGPSGSAAPGRLVLLVCTAQVLAQIGAYTWPALLPGFLTRWPIDNADAGAMIVHWTGPGGAGRVWAHGDFDMDGDVDSTDAGLMIVNWTGAMAQMQGLPSPSSGSAVHSIGSDHAIPEPHTLALILLCIPFVCRRPSV